MRKKLNLTIWEKLVDPICKAATDANRTPNDIANQALEHFTACLDAENPVQVCAIANEVLGKRGVLFAYPAKSIDHLLGQYVGELSEAQSRLFLRFVEAALHAGRKPNKKWLAAAASLARLA